MNAQAKTDKAKTDKGFIFAFERSRTGSIRELQLKDLTKKPAAKAWRWIHFDRVSDLTRKWLADQESLSPTIRDALLEKETRPHISETENGLLIVLRGVNLNPGARPEHMVAIRILLAQQSVITVRHRKLKAVESVREMVEQGKGPKTPSDLVLLLADELAEKMSDAIRATENIIDELEEKDQVLNEQTLRDRLGNVRRRVAQMRRHLSPQRDALSRLMKLGEAWFTGAQKERLSETTNQVIRYVEDLDNMRERASVLHDEMIDRVAVRMNRNMYHVSIMAAIFLPVGLVTSIFGMNINTIPLAQSSWGFWEILGGMFIAVFVQIMIFRKLKWFSP